MQEVYSMLTTLFIIISWILIFTELIYIMKTPFGYSPSQWELRNDFPTRQKTVSSNKKAPVKQINIFKRGRFVDGVSFFTYQKCSVAGLLAFSLYIAKQIPSLCWLKLEV